jgi:hypothetical protein
MISLIRITDADELFTGLLLDEDNSPYPIQKFEWTYPIVGDDIPRPFSAGRHDTRKSADAMTIDCEGEILETTTTLYWSSRKALLSRVLPKREQAFDTYRHSLLEIKVDGDTETYHADVQLTSFAIPIAATGSPTVSKFMFSWSVNFGYWKNAAGEAVLL